MSASANTPFAWETVAIPVTRGLDLRTPDRLVDPRDFLALENARFLRSVGLTRRRGHAASTPRFLDLSALKAVAQGPLPMPTTGHGDRELYDPDVSLPAEWLWGYGVISASAPLDPTGSPLSVFSTERSPGVLCGMASRGTEKLAWDGFRMFTRRSDGWSAAGFSDATLVGLTSARAGGDAVLPMARVTPAVGGNQGDQSCFSAAKTAAMEVNVWVTQQPGGSWALNANVLDASGSPLRVGDRLTTGLHTTSAAAFPVGDYIHVLAYDSVTLDAQLFTLAPPIAGAPPVWTFQSLGVCAAPDFRKISETSFVVMRVTAGGEMLVAYFDQTGAVQAVPLAAWSTLDRGTGATASMAALAVHPQNGDLCALWANGTSVYSRLYSSGGVPLGTTGTLATSLSSVRRVAVDAQYLQTSAGTPTDVFVGFVHGPSASSPPDPFLALHSLSISLPAGATTIALRATTSCNSLTHGAFRVGQRVFVVGTGAGGSGMGFGFIIYDDLLLPVGRILGNEGGGFFNLGAVFLPHLNWRFSGPAKDRLVFHGGVAAFLGPSSVLVGGPNGQYTGYKLDLDFLPPLRSAELGQCVHFAGALPRTYDGFTLSEAAPISSANVGTTQLAGGSLAAGGTYTWRFYEAWRNSRGDEVRGPGFTVGPIGPLGGGNQQVHLSIEPVPTRRTGAYWLVYRTQNAGTTFNLVTSRNSGDPRYVPVSQTVYATLNDGLSDADASTRELDPFNDSSLIPDFPAPACELVAAGQNRLWAAGGEIPPGAVRASKIYQEGEFPAWSPALQLVTSLRGEDVTAIGFTGPYTALFNKTSCYTVEGDGPSNNASGNWSTPRLAFSDEGAVDQSALLLLSEGLLFQSLNGIRLLTTGGSLQDVGRPVDSVAAGLKITGAAYSEDEVRLYSKEGTALVLNRVTGTWATWTGLTTVGAGLGDSLAVLVRPAGDVLEESEEEFTDGGTTYRLRARFAWLRAKELGDFQRVRRLGATGVWQGDHVLTVRVYMDEDDTLVDEWSWTPVSAPTWGAGTWGAGTWGSAGAAAWRWRRRTSRQKCSVVSVEILDDGPDTAGFALTGLVLELGARGGLFRVPWQSGQ